MKFRSILLTILLALSLASCSSNQKKTTTEGQNVKDSKGQVDNGNNSGINLD